MSASVESLQTWTRRQWVRGIGMIVVVQVVLIFAFSQRSVPVPRADDSLTAVKFAPERGANQTLADLSGVPSPTLFALMNRQGFSARSWLESPFVQHSLNDWQEPVRWLAPDAARLGQDFTRKVQTVEINRSSIEDKPAPRADRLDVTADIALRRSRVELGSELKGRSLVAALSLPPQTHTEILTNSIVQIAVNRLGNVLSARLVRGSGSKTADQVAVDQAAHARFNEVRTPDTERLNPLASVIVGDLIFHWHTLPLAETNRVAPAPIK